MYPIACHAEEHPLRLDDIPITPVDVRALWAYETLGGPGGPDIPLKLDALAFGDAIALLATSA